MSVYKSRRKDAAAQYIAEARELRKMTMRIIKRFPKSYRWIITNNLLQLASDIYTNCIRANSIYIHKGMDLNDYNLRHHYLTIAISDTEALLGEITFCYDLVDDGNNYFGSKADYVRVFQRWTEQGNTTLRYIRSILSSDKQRYKTLTKDKQ